MNKVEYNQTEGFPLDVNILDFGQKANQISQGLGHVIAPLAIVTGCIENGNNVSDGLVFIEGELLPFKGGLKQDNIRIVEADNKDDYREFETGTDKKVLISREATFGIGAIKTYKWSDFHRSITIKEIEKRLVHPGFIQDFYGDINNIPVGWFLCDGTNGTPDLRGLFVVGYDNRTIDYNAIGKIGGEKEVTLTVNQIPKHKHNGSTSVNGEHSHSTIIQVSHSGVRRAKDSGSFEIFDKRSSNTGLNGAHSHYFETSEVGENQAHENRPPFYVLAKIMYKG